MAPRKKSTVDVDQPGFGGLDLADSPISSRQGGASVARDLVLTGQKSIRPRPGSVYSYSLPTGVADDWVHDHFTHPESPTVAHLYGTVETCGYIRPAASVGGVVTGGPSDRYWWHHVTIGGPGLASTFIASRGTVRAGTAGYRLKRYITATGITEPGGTVDGGGVPHLGAPTILGVWEADSRLMLMGYAEGLYGPNGIFVDRDTVIIMEPGNPTVWDSDSIIRVGVGDGEMITGCGNVREQTIIFKESRGFVITGISANALGDAQFHKRGFSIANSGPPVNPCAVASTSQGVYYVTRNGLWRTSGSTPVRVSDGVDRLFRDGTLTGDQDQCHRLRLTQLGALLVLGYGYPDGVTDGLLGQLVYDIERGEWVSWTVQTAQFAVEDGRAFFFDYNPDTAVRCLYEVDPTLSEDYLETPEDEGRPEAPVIMRWQSVPSDLGVPGIKYVRGTRVWMNGEGINAPTLSVHSDFAPDGIEIPLNLTGAGGDDHVAVARHGVLGTHLSFGIEGQLVPEGGVVAMVHTLSGSTSGEQADT